MPFSFRLLCDLLEKLERNSRRSSSIDRIQERDTLTILAWFNEHDAIIPRRGLEAVKTSGGLDFASSVERVTMEELDDILDQIAASSSFSSASLRERSSETKWMIRIISKNYSPARVPETLVMTAVGLLGSPTIRHMPIQPAVDTCDKLKEIASMELESQAGIMIVRTTCEKARSIRHYCQLAGPRRMSVERKYDGEYCQIHIDLNKSGADIKIFSKSGRDSTSDRIGIHRALRDSLGLYTAGCKIKKIEPFHKIRRHMKRSGRFLGAARDSPVKSSEHLMIVFYDILLLDDIVCGLDTHDERRETFARAIIHRWEGFVLKGYDDPYFLFNGNRLFIKLKKDYILGLGDAADFVIIGGRCDAGDEHELGIGSLWWTSFYVRCIENKDEVCCFNIKLRFSLFAKSIPEFDLVELFKYLFIVEVVSAGFDKLTNDRSFRDTISFEELQEMAQRCLEIPNDGE
ncbi:hypothetical protein EDB81DRAFT_847037 [Dactylonectria macrodidyma]|uniref:ATP-dependent DNA ligase family profile domain-containing protein n=1 Tax=Dactylonectria macrodidyma TaxID=307937 RepID=A0A9P9DUH7_9HYPO|nr:hypothetical protein EDB81DRAFT_847037 [Dactylonectria macrodidyma]